MGTPHASSFVGHDILTSRGVDATHAVEASHGSAWPWAAASGWEPRWPLGRRNASSKLCASDRGAVTRHRINEAPGGVHWRRTHAAEVAPPTMMSYQSSQAMGPPRLQTVGKFLVARLRGESDPIPLASGRCSCNANMKHERERATEGVHLCADQLAGRSRSFVSHPAEQANPHA